MKTLQQAHKSQGKLYANKPFARDTCCSLALLQMTQRQCLPFPQGVYTSVWILAFLLPPGTVSVLTKGKAAAKAVTFGFMSEPPAFSRAAQKLPVIFLIMPIQEQAP